MQSTEVTRQIIDLIDMGNHIGRVKYSQAERQGNHHKFKDLTPNDIQHFTSAQFLTPERNVVQRLWQYNCLDNTELLITYLDVWTATVDAGTNIVVFFSTDAALTATLGFRMNGIPCDSQPAFAALMGVPVLLYVPSTRNIELVYNASGSGAPAQNNPLNMVTSVRGFLVKHGKGERFKQISTYVANVSKQVNQDGTTSTITATP